jgi:CRP-like cAMP-binding protein
MRKMQHGNERREHRLLVTRFSKGDYIMRKGEAATFLAILLQGELGVRLGRGGGFPRRLHKGSLFGERGMFNAGNLRAADVIAMTDGYVGTMLYSELELLGETYPELMRTFNLQMAKGALEEKLADTGMGVDDLEQPALERHINDLLTMQAGARWKSRHRELQALREGLYADLHAEKESQAVDVLSASNGKSRSSKGSGGGVGAGVGRALRGVFSRTKGSSSGQT